ncbi:hypothetical protein [Leptotrichia buccalis]|uniref:Uncharacterized protein n=1 Tax=Leptotrichia buccalis (strain ATCC 14201 / DSM 1135 / JCM 12969 / NCTC 10249 / C-1013-b) TaxID=523794 RepID=C7N9H5_LEPBD|nr:hypothetical protein [Leptotrichia buccalis]ACV38806.1 hypothetical protein Lebu_0903 [Leptotrichia buccalis C-1013-b]
MNIFKNKLLKVKKNLFNQVTEIGTTDLIDKNKYDLLVYTVDEIGSFADLLDYLYNNNDEEPFFSNEFLGIGLVNYWYEMEEDERDLYIVQYFNDREIKIYYSYEELFHYMFSYYLENICCFADILNKIENSFQRYIEEINNNKKYKLNLNIEKILKRDKLRNFLIEYNYDIQIEKHISYFSINIAKKFFSYLMNKNILLEFLKGKRKFIRVNGYFSGFDKILESYAVIIEKNVKIEYYNQFLENDINLYYSQYSDSEKKKFEIYKNKRITANMEEISKQDFIKELEIIVNAYEKIYNDNEIKGMFEKFKEELGE